VHLRGVRTAEGVPRVVERPTLATLYEQHVGRVIALARLLTGDDHVAEDVAQEAFVRTAGRFAHLRQPDAFAGYLRRTVVNLCRGRFRRLRIERDWLRRQRREEPTASPAFDPADRVTVWHAIEQLPWRQRAAVVLRYYEDLPQPEVAELLRCSVGAVESLLSRAMASLRESIGEEGLR
jgi:RNA polymerase sigma-70 factor (sigma-E family)